MAIAIGYENPIDDKLPPQEILFLIFERLTKRGVDFAAVAKRLSDWTSSVPEICDAHDSEDAAKIAYSITRFRNDILAHAQDWAHLINTGRLDELGESIQSFVRHPVGLQSPMKYSDTGDMIQKICREYKISLGLKPSKTFGTFYGGNPRGYMGDFIPKTARGLSLEDASLFLHAVFYVDYEYATAQREAGRNLPEPMMWRVTVRGKGGDFEEKYICGRAREDVFNEATRCRLTPVKVELVHAATRSQKPRRGNSTELPVNFWVVVAIIVLLSIVGLIVFMRRHKPDGNIESNKKAELTPRAVPTPVKPAKARPVKEEEESEPKVVTNFVNNVWRDEKGRPHYKVARTIRPGQNTIINGKPWKPEKPVFHHPSEVELDVLLSRRPGERIFGEVNWRAFERDLPNALADRVEILPDDTQDIVERKQAVIEAKKELVAAIKAGEDPIEILKASRDDVNKLADVRDNLLSTVAELKQEGASEQEIEDAVEAANLILKKYNIEKPLISPRTMRERGEAAKLRKLQESKGRK
ncbi:MAG: hypothetical protein II863_09405 [Kiritimatiellae bacterium]|nr:hypothetical protein [Kiritimatiellia bacterium]